MQILRIRTLDIIYDLFLWEDAHFELYDSEKPPDYFIRIEVPTTKVIMDGKERQVGVARYVQDERTPDEAEFAIVLADQWQRSGLGTKLLGSLVDAARTRGMRRLVATTQSTNDGMLALARRMGFRLALNPASATITDLTLDL